MRPISSAGAARSHHPLQLAALFAGSERTLDLRDEALVHLDKPLASPIAMLFIVGRARHYYFEAGVLLEQRW